MKSGRGGSLDWGGPTTGKGELLLQFTLFCSLPSVLLGKVISVVCVFVAVALDIAVATLFETRSL